MLDPTTGRPASVPGAPERATGAPEVANGPPSPEPLGPASSGANGVVAPQRPKIGDTRPAPPLSKATEDLPAATGNGRKGQSSAPSQATELPRTGDGDGPGPLTPVGGAARRRRGGRGRSRSGQASAAAAGRGERGGRKRRGERGEPGPYDRSPGGEDEGRGQARSRVARSAGPLAVTSPTTAASSGPGSVAAPPLSTPGPRPAWPARRPLPDVRARRARGDSHRGAGGTGAHRALRRQAPGRCEPDRRQHLSRAGEERPSGHGSGLRRHRDPEERRPLLGRRLLRPGRRRAPGGRRSHRAPSPAWPDDRLPGHEEPDRSEGGPAHPGGVHPGPLRRAGTRVGDLRDLAASRRQRTPPAAQDPRRRPPGGPWPHRADGRGRGERRGPAP